MKWITIKLSSRFNIGFALIGIAIVAYILLWSYRSTLKNSASSSLNTSTLSTSSASLNTTRYKAFAFEPEMVDMTGGLASMGCLNHHIDCEADERIHTIRINPFSIGIYEVTNSQYVPFLNAIGTHKRPHDKQQLLEIQQEDKDSRILYHEGKYSVEPGYENYPIVEICWQGAATYAAWLSQITGKNYRLPSEAEWEYMARAGTSSQYPWKHYQWNDQANCDGCSGSWNDVDELKPVGSYPPNAWGVYDVLGNVWEWTCSAYDAQYAGDEGKCARTKPDQKLALRGGSFFNAPWDTRLSNRTYQTMWHQDYHSGFRLAISAENNL